MMSGPNTVRTLIEQQAQARPQAIYALDATGAHSLSFAQLAQGCRSVAALLQAHGSQPGDTVSMVMPNGLMTLQLLLGAMHGGWCVNPVNLLAQPDQMRHVLSHSDCKLVLVSPDWEARVRAILGTIESEVERELELVVISPDAAALPHITQAATSNIASPDSDDIALLMYTSGTTGLPKGVMLTHGNLFANAQSISAEHALTAADRVLAVLPLYHINAFSITMLATLAHGGSLVMPSKFSAAQFWQQAIDRECTWINVVPTMISYLLEGELPARADTQRIRFCRSASAPLAPEQLTQFEQKFGISIIETMGLTETAAPSFSNPLTRSERKLGAVGKASGCEARVIDANLVPIPDGQTGEVAIRGPHVMRGYYKNAAATQAAFTPDGWLRTGDLGHRDSDGFFFITGRIKELIIKGGENIAPREIDEALLRHPAILDAAAVGIPDKHYGQEIMVCVVLKEDHDLDEASLRQFSTEQLGRYKSPTIIRFVPELPRGPSGKVQRLKLLDFLEMP
jgi:long-chain acyl-CoA synthetase